MVFETGGSPFPAAAAARAAAGGFLGGIFWEGPKWGGSAG